MKNRIDYYLLLSLDALKDYIVISEFSTSCDSRCL